MKLRFVAGDGSLAGFVDLADVNHQRGDAWTGSHRVEKSVRPPGFELGQVFCDSTEVEALIYNPRHGHVVGMMVPQRWSDDHLRAQQAQQANDLLARIVRVLEAAIGQAQVDAAAEAKLQGRGLCLPVPVFGGSPGSQLAAAEVDHGGALTPGHREREGAAALQLGIIRVSHEGDDVAFCGLSEYSSLWHCLPLLALAGIHAITSRP